MRNMKKRLFGLLLALVMVLSLLPAVNGQTVASGVCGENVTWTLDDYGTLTISGSGDMADYSMVTDRPWDEKREDIHVVVIEEGVTGIGQQAFYICTNLTGAMIPDTVTKLGDYAFASCTSLTEVTIPDSVKTMGRYVFLNCISLTGITLPDSVTTLGSAVFSGCASLTEVTLPASVTTLGDFMFSGCKRLTEVTVPASVTMLGTSVFFNCTSLTDVTYEGVNAPTGGSFAFMESAVSEVLVPQGYTETTFCGKNVKKGYSVAVDSGITGGTVSVDRTIAAEGDPVTVAAVPDSGYALQSVSAVDQSGEDAALEPLENNRYAFAMPAGNVTITAVFRNENAGSGSSGSGSSGSSSGSYYPTYWPVVDETTVGGAEAEERYIVLCRKLNVREGAGTQSEKIGSLSRGEVVKGEDTGSGWIRIEYEGKTAYISAQYVQRVDAGCEKTVTVLCRRLNVRAGADTRFEKVGSASRGDELCVVGEQNGWYEVLYNGGSAWICAKYAA